MFNHIVFDISGICNAKCPYCATGLSNLNKKINNNKNINYSFIKIKNFEKALDYILDNKIFNVEYGSIDLYNWGEPFLHPEFDSIINVLNFRNIKFHISTNASKVPLLLPTTSMENLKSLYFSVSGFSQSSYNRIHGFNLELIKKNIIQIIKMFEDAGYKGSTTISYHVYQFNLKEYKEALYFAKTNNINIWPYYAYFNYYEYGKNYLNNSLNYDILKKASKELMLFYVEELISGRGNNYVCPQFDILTIDENCNVLTCCVIPKGYQSYSFGNLFYLSLEKINELKIIQKECSNCQKLNYDYWVNNPEQSKFLMPFIKIPEAFIKLFENNKQYEKAWEVLSFVYYTRSDLKQAFCLDFVQNINFHISLLQWAITAGISYDSAKSILEKHGNKYKLMLDALIIK